LLAIVVSGSIYICVEQIHLSGDARLILCFLASDTFKLSM
jgi:hypothetical protein